jgi:hypothetical protein
MAGREGAIVSLSSARDDVDDADSGVGGLAPAYAVAELE